MNINGARRRLAFALQRARLDATGDIRLPRVSWRTQQHNNHPFPAVLQARRTKSDHVLDLRKPKTHFCFKYWLAVRRTPSLAMNHAHTAQPALHGLMQKSQSAARASKRRIWCKSSCASMRQTPRRSCARYHAGYADEEKPIPPHPSKLQARNHQKGRARRRAKALPPAARAAVALHAGDEHLRAALRIIL